MTEASLDAAGKTLIGSSEHAPVKWMDEGWGRAFIGLAGLGSNKPRSYIFAFLRVVIYPHAFLIPAALAAAWLAHPRHITPVAMVLLIFGYVIAGGIAVVQSVVRSHRRPWLSVVSVRPTLDWRRLAIGAGVQAALILPLLAVVYFFASQLLRSLPSATVLIVAVLLVPFQAASEEILFRGYLTQALGRIFQSRTVIVVIVAVLFAAMHWTTYGALTMPYMFAFSIILSFVSLRDEGLELTIGAHTAMNWIGVGEINAMASGQLPPQVAWLHFPALAVQGILFYALTRLLVRRCCGERRSTPLKTAALPH